MRDIRKREAECHNNTRLFVAGSLFGNIVFAKCSAQLTSDIGSGLGLRFGKWEGGQRVE